MARGRWILETKPEVGGFLIERHDVVTHPEEGQTDVYPIEILRLFRNHPAIEPSTPHLVHFTKLAEN